MLIVMCMAAFFINNDALPLDTGEAKTIVTARDMVANGDWMNPIMNGVSRLDKPPLASWVAAFVECSYPYNISAQRIAAGIMGLMWALFFFGVARYMDRRRGFAEIATFVFLTCYNVIYAGRIVGRDIYSDAFMMGGIYFMMRLLYDHRYFPRPHKWRWAMLSGLCMGLSFLSDGVVSFYSMLLPFIITIMAYKPTDMKGKWMPSLLGIALCLLVSGWWMVNLAVQKDGAVSDFFMTQWSLWTNSHVRPWFYYWRFFSEMGVWAVFMIAALLVPYWSKRVSTKRIYQMALLWLVVALVLLSLLPSKNMSDLVVVMPPCSLAVACLIFYYVNKWPKDLLGKAVFYVNGYVVSLIVLGLPIFVQVRLVRKDIIDVGTGLVVEVLLLALAVYLFVSTYRREMKGIVKGVIALFMVVECFLLGSFGGLFGNPRQRSISILQDNVEWRSLPLYHKADENLRIELVFEAQKNIKALDLDNEVAVMSALPCLVLTQKELASEMPASILNKVDTVNLGFFDDNRLPRHNEHYNTDFVQQVNLLRAKPIDVP